LTATPGRQATRNGAACPEFGACRGVRWYFSQPSGVARERVSNGRGVRGIAVVGLRCAACPEPRMGIAERRERCAKFGAESAEPHL
jgi:hypothetical protein